MRLKKLSNHFLVAMPSLHNTLFEKSIILLCEHNKKGSMGLIINKPMVESDENKSLFLDTIFENSKIDSKIYFGGPVDLNTFFVLHDAQYLTKETLHISDSMSLTSNKKIINDMKKGQGPNSFRLNIGYAGWSAGQLEDEIKNGDWLFTPASSDFVFNMPDNEMWNQTAKSIGIDTQGSTISGNA